MPSGAADVLPRVGALVEGPGFHPFLSGRENLRRVAATEPLLPTRAIPAAVDAALERVGLGNAADRRFRGYSLGMKQRLGLAGALLLPRRLVILDEPTNGLDPAGTRDVRRIIAELHAGGATVVVSSHLLTEVEATCTHVAVLQSGSLIAEGELHRLLDAGATGLVVTTPDTDLAVATLRAAAWTRVPRRRRRTRCRRARGRRTGGDRAAGPGRGGRARGAAQRPRLEELFARLTETARECRIRRRERAAERQPAATARSDAPRTAPLHRLLGAEVRWVLRRPRS
jgi:ABC-2 type transport system ATP-binding protein